MSGAMIYQETLRILRGLNLPETAETDVIAALEVARPNNPLDVAYWATLQAKLERDESIWRAAAVFFSFAAANLADDVSDGDCHYLFCIHIFTSYLLFNIIIKLKNIYVKIFKRDIKGRIQE